MNDEGGWTISSTGVADSVTDTAGIEHECRRQAEQNQTAIALLRSWANVSEEEAAEQRETLSFLMRALNEDRLSERDRL
ncbi:MAG: hypothetical protein QOG89_3176 [Thermomicrobiales bacterium]|nr:hypothetical protein [Thermomicrobiales bacterium]